MDAFFASVAGLMAVGVSAERQGPQVRSAKIDFRILLGFTLKTVLELKPLQGFGRSGIARVSTLATTGSAKICFA
jgi:hypothetical protein